MPVLSSPAIATGKQIADNQNKQLKNEAFVPFLCEWRNWMSEEKYFVEEYVVFKICDTHY